MKKLIALLFFLNCTCSVFSQTLPRVIEPSPSVMQLQKYGDYPVSNFTGIPDINIPLYTIKEGDLEFPISISYHASGSRPSDANGMVGMGWTLNYGGQISRTIMGEGDEVHALLDTIYTSEQLRLMENTDFRDDYLKRLLSYGDSEPDIFSYNFNGHTGKFIFKRGRPFVPLLLPRKPIKFMPHFTTISNTLLDYFNVIDENGYKYKLIYSDMPQGAYCPTGWVLAEMVSPTDSTNKVTFGGPGNWISERAYKRVDILQVDDDMSRPVAYRACWVENSGGGGTKPLTDFLTYFTPTAGRDDYDVTYTTSFPGSVTFRSGRVVFIQDPVTKMLSKIEIRDRNNGLLKSITFEYVTKPTRRTLLKEIKFYDNNAQFVNKYSFDYNNEMYGFMDNIELASEDYWGYYNGSYLSETGLMPNWEISLQNGGYDSRVIGNNTRQTNEQYMKTFVLEKITYPTGGTTTFEFEPNKYMGNQITNYSGQQVGGLRIAKITNLASTIAVPEVKTYVYGLESSEECGYGMLDVRPGNIDDYCFSQRGYLENRETTGPIDLWESWRRRVYRSEPYINLTPHGSPVVYPVVTEYLGDGIHNVSKTIYSYSYPTEVTTGKFDTNGVYDGEFNVIQYMSFTNPYKEWEYGRLLGKSYYKNVDGIYKATGSEYNTYEDIPGETERGFQAHRFVYYNYDGCRIDDHNLDYLVYSHGEVQIQSVYNYRDYYIESGESRLKNTAKYYSSSNGIGSVGTRTNYEYGNSVHGFPTLKKTFISSGDSILTVLKYPHDFATAQPYTEMVNDRHIWSPVIEQIDYKNSINSVPLQATKTDYWKWPGNAILPKTISIKQGNGNYEPKIQYLGYDNRGNIKSVSKTTGPKISYLWGYNKVYPIAEVMNADTTEIFYENFEEGTGINYYNDFRTGHRCYNGNYIKGLTGLNNKSYVLSYWQKLAGNWQLQKSIVNVINGSYTINISGLIDDIRFYPTGAQMTTYTYDLLVGMTSQTDPKGMTTTYEYDNFQRLKTIKDQDGKIVKRYDYHYKP